MVLDNETTLSELKSSVKQFCTIRDWDQYHNAKDLAIGVATESAELLQLFRFKSPAEADDLFNEPASREKIADEMADVLFFLLRLAQKYDIDLTYAFYKKMAMNEQKYPVEKVKGLNKKYTEL